MKKINRFLTLLGLSLFFTQVIAKPFNCLQSRHPFGIKASKEEVTELYEALEFSPKLSKTGKSLVTVTGFGFDVLSDNNTQPSWFIQDLMTFAGTAKAPILDVGGGYGGLSHKMLQQGATVIFNDLDERQLLYGMSQIDPALREHLWLNRHHFPQKMIIPPQKLSAVVFHRVLHFMSGDQIEEGLAKVNKWLVPGGKVFIAVLPPQHGEYKDKILVTYDKRWEQGVAWPGEGLSSKVLLPDQSYALPNKLHVMDERPLTLALQKYGFKVEKSGFIEMNRFGNQAKRQGQELFGLIAIKEHDHPKKAV